MRVAPFVRSDTKLSVQSVTSVTVELTDKLDKTGFLVPQSISKIGMTQNQNI